MQKPGSSATSKKRSLLQVLDMNLLRVFDAVYVERGVTKAADRLNLTPSAVSHSLNKLRFALQDELFTRGPHGMGPTARADDIANSLRTILPMLEEALGPAEFIPATATRTFKIACVPYLNSVFIPQFLAAVYREAPKIRFEIQAISENLVDALEAGQIDVAIGGFRRMPPRFVAEEIQKEKAVWVVRSDNPLGRKRVTLRALTSIPHVEVRLGSLQGMAPDSYNARHGLELLAQLNTLGVLDAACLAAGYARDVIWIAPDSFTALAIVRELNATCLLPERFARLFAGDFGLKIIDAPYLASPMVIRMLYSRDAVSQASMRWLLDMIRKSFSAG